MASHYPTDLQVVVMCQETQKNASKVGENVNHAGFETL